MTTTDNQLTLFKPFDVTSADTDMNNRLRLGSLVNMLIQSAISSADCLGFGFSGLKTQHLFWVLSRLSIEIYEPILWYDKVVVETWPKDIERIIYLRDFIVRNQHNKILAKATSGWLAIDLQNKRPKVIQGLEGEVFYKLKDKHALEHSPEKLGLIQSEDKSLHTATYFDIDLNQHVTSTRYVDWMMDRFSLDFHKNNFPKALTINYIKETMPESTIELSKLEVAEKIFQFEGNNITLPATAFRGKIQF